jgi:deoxyribose-phosphate aldolase
MNAAARLLAALDHTRLEAEDTAVTISDWCAAAAAGARPVAVCVYPAHAAAARAALDAADAGEIAVAAVANFPDGEPDPGSALRDIRVALAAGASEIDLVFPWRAYRAGDAGAGMRMLGRCREACSGKLLKVILETGELGDLRLIRELSAMALDAGADFIKTSTGMVATGATPEAAGAVLECIRDRGCGGFKASGGIRTLEQARIYLDLADRVCGDGWATPAKFRIGSSFMLAGIRAAIDIR